MASTFWFWLWLLGALQLAPPPALTGRPAAGRASISGKVIQAGTSQPLTGAQVTLQPSGISTVTNPVGEFRLSVPAGRYTLIVQRDGFIPQANPQSGISEFGMAVSLGSGQTRENVVLAMIAAPTISGHTYLPNGENLAAAVVQAYRRLYTPHGPRIRIIKTALTNDAGEYRLFWLGFGEYLVSASYSRRAQRAALGGVRLSPNVSDPDDGYATVFYGGGTSVAEAQRIRLTPGVDAGSLNIVFSDIPRFKIQGRVVSPSPTLPADLRLTFVPEGSDIVLDNSTSFVSMATDGSFSIPGVSPGSYVMVAFSAPLSSDVVRVQVTNRDVEKLSIPLFPTFNINGRISVDGNPRTNVSAKINLVRTSPEIDLRVETATAADGSFALFGVGQGEYDVSVEPLPPGSYLRSIRFGGRDVLAGGMRVGLDPNASLEIALSSAGAAVQGRVVNPAGDPASGARVVLVPERRYRRRADRYIVGVTDAAGSFQMSGVPPGQYTAFAFEQIEPGAYYAFAYDPLVDLRFRNRGLNTNVNDVQTTTLELKLIPAADTAGGL